MSNSRPSSPKTPRKDEEKKFTGLNFEALEEEARAVLESVERKLGSEVGPSHSTTTTTTSTTEASAHHSEVGVAGAAPSAGAPEPEEEIHPLDRPPSPTPDVRQRKHRRAGEIVTRAAQTTGQEITKYITSETLPYTVPAFTFIPPVPPAGQAIVKTGMPPVNGVVGDMLYALTEKPDPMEGLRRRGGGNAWVGLAIDGGSKAVAIFTVGAVSYPLGKWAIKYGPMLVNHPNEYAQIAGQIMTVDLYNIPIYGTLGYLGYEATRRLGMKALGCAVHPQPEPETKNEKEITWYQFAGQYPVRLFTTYAKFETFLAYFNLASLRANDPVMEALASDPRFQIGIFLALDALTRLTNHFAFSKNPMEELVPKNQRTVKVTSIEDVTDQPATEGDLEAGGAEIEEVEDNAVVEYAAPSRKDEAKWALLRTGMWLFFAGAVYGSQQLARYYLCDEEEVENLCDPELMSNRAAMTALSFAAPAAADFTVRQAGPALLKGAENVGSAMVSAASATGSGISYAARKFAGLFKPAPADSARDPLLQEIREEQERRAETPAPRGMGSGS